MKRTQCLLCLLCFVYFFTQQVARNGRIKKTAKLYYNAHVTMHNATKIFIESQMQMQMLQATAVQLEEK